MRVRRRPLSDVVAFAAIGGLAVIAVSLLHSGDAKLALDAYFLFLGALALLAATRVGGRLTDDDKPSEIEQLLRPGAFRSRRRTPPRRQLSELARVERQVTLAAGSSFDLHVRLRPTIREIAEYRLLTHYGLLLDDQPDRARRLLGEPIWELVRPDRELPENRHAPGLSVRELDEVVSALERL
jgi:hypothetical protein